MATLVDATCSECFMPQQVELNPRRSEITCSFCRHSVPMFEKREVDAIRASLALERRKMYIALALFGGAIFLFGLYALVNTTDDLVEIPIEGKTIVAELVKRDAASITISDPETGKDEETLRFTTILAPQISQIRQDYPYVSEELAAERAGDEHIKIRRQEARGTILFVLAMLTALGAIAFAGIAGQDKLVCEF